MEKKKKVLSSEDELIQLASIWQPNKVGRNRQEDGTVPGWHEWSKLHSQRDDDIVICRGRDGWQKEQQQHQASTNHLSILSWNILSDTWYQKSKSEGEYTHVDDAVGEWSYRFQLLIKEWITPMQPDIVAFQEVDYDKFEVDVLPTLRSLGYDGKMQNPKKKAKTQPCGVATFWKQSNKFDFVTEKSSSRTQCVVLNFNGIDEKQQCQQQEQICIANVHLESSQNEIASGHRARQLNSALSFASSTEVSKTAAVIVCGDCNTGVDAQIFHVLREYQWHGHSLSSVYEHPNTHTTLPVSVATFMVPNHHYVIDHMLYDQDTLRLKCALDAFTHEEKQEHIYATGDECGFPSKFCPSDHIPIGAIFELLPLKPISKERQEELKAEWETIQSQCPLQFKGKPTPEQIGQQRSYKATVNSWKESFKNNAVEYEYVITELLTKR